MAACIAVAILIVTAIAVAMAVRSRRRHIDHSWHRAVRTARREDGRYRR